MSRDLDRSYMEKAARAALKGRGFVEPNPLVGAVLVSDGQVRGIGWHADYGGPHAEVAALRKAGEAARGGTLYVTLEPCSTQGKTSPCTEAILEAGISRVVVGSIDPNPAHNGQGLRLLTEAGVSVAVRNDEVCLKLINRFYRALNRDRPYVILKWAMTLDGRIAARNGSSQWISGEKSRKTVHRLRGHADAIMVGSRTIVADDPKLNCRLRKAPLVPLRVVVDPDLDTPPRSRLLRIGKKNSDRVGPAMIFASAAADQQKEETLKRAGADVIRLSCDGRDEGAFLELALRDLRQKGVERLLVEGGSFLFTSFVEARLADQVVAFVAPKLVGGRDALSPVEGKGAASMDDAVSLCDVTVTISGDDAVLVGFFQ